MKDEDIQNLLGGFATDTLTDQEREALFTAALRNQKLFDALADEQALRELLSDPASRRQVLDALQPEKRGAFEWLTGWMRRPVVWALAGTAVAALVVAIAIRQPRRRPQPVMQPITEMARSEPRPETSAPVANPAPPAQAERRESRKKPAFQAPARAVTGAATARSSAPAPVAAPPAAPPQVATAPPAATPSQPAPAPQPAPPPQPAKMKVAVLDFNSGQTVAKDADSVRPDAGREASDLLGKKLDASQFTVIDRKKVEQALQSQNLVSRDLDASAAASFGRSVGADAVIVGSVTAATPPAESAKGAVAGRFRSVSPLAANKAVGGIAAERQLEVTATAINTKTSGRLAKARAPAQAGLSSAVDSVASSLNQQLQQNIAAKINGLVTHVAESVLTLNVGAKEGLKVGDKLQIRRDGKTLGVVTITSVRDAESQGTFQGSGAVQTGDNVVSR